MGPQHYLQQASASRPRFNKQFNHLWSLVSFSLLFTLQSGEVCACIGLFFSIKSLFPHLRPRCISFPSDRAYPTDHQTLYFISCGKKHGNCPTILTSGQVLAGILFGCIFLASLCLRIFRLRHEKLDVPCCLVPVANCNSPGEVPFLHPGPGGPE